MTPAEVAERGGKFIYFLKRYISEGETKIAGTSWVIPKMIGMEAGPAYEMPDGHEVIIFWRHIYSTGEFTEQHVLEYESGAASSLDGWEID